MVIGAAVLLLASTPAAYAGMSNERLDLAAGLEEALGHFRALELNLDENNAELAVVHATHPIAELYDAMKPTLVATDPALDRLVLDTLDGLKTRATTDMSREQAQQAIDDAKAVVEAARTAVVGEALSADPAFKMKLMKGLLETSIAEYGEAVESGEITEMAEFQDGSAFVWRAGVIFGEIRGEIDADKADSIDAMFADVRDAYDDLAPPPRVAALTNGIISELDGLVAGAYQERLDLAAGLEEALGHFRALELNLDENNAELAVVHATHPIAELYDAMKPTLVATDPALDEQVLATLDGLRESAASKSVSRWQAQQAIEDAKGVVEAARTAVVGDALSADPAFKMKLMKGLLETSVAEYGEAVESGRVVEMAEFQDGSAFVWRAGVIFGEIRGEIDGAEAAEIDSAFDAVNAAYDGLADPSEVAELTGGIIATIDDLTGADASGMGAGDGLERYTTTINQLLVDAKSEYGAGNNDLALSYVTKAYLDNFEFLEGPLVEAGEEDLMGEIEVLMREELRGMIRSGEPVGDVGAQIDTVLARMQVASGVLFPSGMGAEEGGMAAAADGPAASYSLEERLDLAAGLEEALGHFRALELNLDDNNAELAVVHATHPVAELYDAMKPTLVSADPALDRLMADTLDGLAERASTDVSRAEAQQAIDDAKGVVEAARTAVVGDAIASDPVFRMKLMKGLLETSVAEYGEAVESGRVVEMAEFQDGSAFVWRAGVIYGEIQGSIENRHAAEEIDGFFEDVNDAYDRLAPPSQVATLTNGIIRELDEIMGVDEGAGEAMDEGARLDAYVATIRQLLEDARAEYRAGNNDLALSYVTKAYLDNYEFLEGPLVEAGERELMVEVEELMREELRTMIRNGAPVADVEAQIDTIQERMDTVAVIVPEFGTVAVAVLAVAIVAIVAVTARSRLGMAPGP